MLCLRHPSIKRPRAWQASQDFSAARAISGNSIPPVSRAPEDKQPESPPLAEVLALGLAVLGTHSRPSQQKGTHPDALLSATQRCSWRWTGDSSSIHRAQSAWRRPLDCPLPPHSSSREVQAEDRISRGTRFMVGRVACASRQLQDNGKGFASASEA